MGNESNEQEFWLKKDGSGQMGRVMGKHEKEMGDQILQDGEISFPPELELQAGTHANRRKFEHELDLNKTHTFSTPRDWRWVLEVGNERAEKKTGDRIDVGWWTLFWLMFGAMTLGSVLTAGLGLLILAGARTGA